MASTKAVSLSREVPESVRSLVEVALTDDDLDRASDHACEALRRVRFPFVRGRDLPVCLASELDEDQRNTILALAAREELETHRFAAPRKTRVVRRWLGLDPPTALEAAVTYELAGKTLTEPRWARYLRDQRAMLEDLPSDAVETLEVGVELSADAYGIHPLPGFLMNITQALGARALPLAKRYLAIFSDELAAKTLEHERRWMQQNKGFMQRAFVSANEPFDERLAPFLSFRECDDDEMVRTVAWLPEAQRDAIVRAVLERDALWRVRRGAMILKAFALPETAALVAQLHVADKPDSQSPPAVKKATGAIIDAAAKAQPSIASILAPALSPAARKALSIKATKSTEPKESTPPEWKPLDAKAPINARLSNLVDGYDAGCHRGKACVAMSKELFALLSAAFRQKPTICRRPASLRDNERALIDLALTHLSGLGLLDAGLWDTHEEVRSALGLGPPTAQDVELDVEGDRAPAWCFIREHLHSDSPARSSLIEAVMKLDEARRFSLWKSFFIRTGRKRDAYSYWQGIERVDYGAPANKAKPPGPHRPKLCLLVSALGVAIGERAEQFAISRATDTSELTNPSLLEGALALATLRAFADARGQALDDRWSAARATIIAFDHVKRDPALLAAIDGVDATTSTANARRGRA